MRRKHKSQIKDKLREAYFDHENPGSYGGKKRLYRSVNLKVSDKFKAEQWFANTDSYTLYRSPGKDFNVYRP